MQTLLLELLLTNVLNKTIGTQDTFLGHHLYSSLVYILTITFGISGWCLSDSMVLILSYLISIDVKEKIYINRAKVLIGIGKHFQKVQYSTFNRKFKVLLNLTWFATRL